MKRVLAGAVSAMLLTGCGTILHGRDDAIFVDSRPADADAYIICVGGSDRGTTPVKLEIPRRAYDCNLTVEKAGYKAHRITVERGFSRGYWANFALSPIAFLLVKGDERDLSYEAFAAGLSGGIGFLVDQMTGAKYDNDPEEIVVELEPAP